MDANKWPLKNKKGYLKIHITVNMKTKEILGLKITDEKVHDRKVMEQSVEQVFENKDIQIESVLADDGAYMIILLRISNIFCKIKGLSQA